MPLVGRSGRCGVDHLRARRRRCRGPPALGGRTDDGVDLTGDQIRRLFDLPATSRRSDGGRTRAAVASSRPKRQRSTPRRTSATSRAWFDEEMDKLDRWAEDKRTGLKADLREHDDTLKALKREARQAPSLPRSSRSKNGSSRSRQPRGGMAGVRRRGP